MFLLSTGALVVIVFNTNPKSGQEVTTFSFFLFSFITFYTLIAIIGLSLGKKKEKILRRARVLGVLRRSFLISLALVGTAVFSSIHVLNLLSFITFIFTLILTEIFFVYRRTEQARL